MTAVPLRISRRALGAFLAAALTAGGASIPALPAHADDDAVPYWAAIDQDLAYMRVGPGEQYQIAWVYKRADLPVKVVRREGPWRLVEDQDGARGWMRDLLLRRERMAVIVGKGETEMRAEPLPRAKVIWRAEPGVIG